MMIKKILFTIKKKKEYLLKILLWKRNKKVLNHHWTVQEDLSFMKLSKFLERYSDCNYTVDYKQIQKWESKHKWVGAQIYKDRVYMIPSDMSSVMIFYNERERLIGKLSDSLFKWTGGTVWNENVYAFARSSNTLLKINTFNDTVCEISMPYKYNGEHHYGGVCTPEGKIYQPPRNTDHILVTDLRKKISYKIQIAPSVWNMKFHYCGTICHPNGFIYFFPEKENKVIKLDMQTEAWTFIGPPISSTTYDAKVYTDGNIYGFSAYNPGILKINVQHDEVQIIHVNHKFGAFGTKLGINGLLYSVPGNGDAIWTYNPRNDQCHILFKFPNHEKEKYAGGVISRSGEIIFAVASANAFIKLKPVQKDITIPYELYEKYFIDCY